MVLTTCNRKIIANVCTKK